MAETIAESIWKDGQLDSARRVLRQLLLKRFSTVAPELLQRIDNATDVDRLTAAALQVLEITTPDDLKL